MASDGRDRRTVWRALTAGVTVWAVCGSALVTVVVRAGGDGGAGVVAVAMALVAGAFLSSAWLLLAALLDIVAGEPPSRRRAVWTVAVVLFTFASPLLVAGAQAAR